MANEDKNTVTIDYKLEPGDVVRHKNGGYAIVTRYKTGNDYADVVGADGMTGFANMSDWDITGLCIDEMQKALRELADVEKYCK